MAVLGQSRSGVPQRPSEPTEEGWPALYRTVRDADVTKIDDCRDDIDTLLVFAGLYSAVLTAFVVESYTHLQQDPQDVIIGLLQHIATQNYIYGPGFINSTSPPPSPPPFEPPLWAIRVNVLWFTSLLLSLVSASFGILVKQWLREYLAIDYSSPRERLRARQYRSPAIANWKVFEIAAFLPLLLQLSLGLFFLGLCFFTAAVHDSIGRTTTPLACAWAFLFFVTTIAPLFSPRCPFKTTFLKSALKAGRCYAISPLRVMLRSNGQPVIDCLSLACIISTELALAIAEYISAGWDLLLEAIGSFMDSIPWEWAQRVYFVIMLVVLAPALLPVTAYPRLRRVFALWKQSASKVAAHEEEEVIKTEEEDTGVLLSVDSLASDDALLSTMFDVLQQQVGASSEKIVKFILQIIGQRIGVSLDASRLTFVPDLRPLSKLAWSATTDAIASLLQHEPSTLASDSPDWIFNSIIILLYPSSFELSDTAARALHGHIVRSPQTPDDRCADEVHLKRCLVLTKARQPVTSLQPGFPSTDMCLRCIMDVYMALLCQDAAHFHPSIRHLLDMHISDDSFMASPDKLPQNLFDMIMSLIHEIISSHKDLAEVHGSHEALHIVLQYGKKFGRRNDVVKLCRQLLLTESGARTLLAYFAPLNSRRRVEEDTVREILAEVHGMSSLEEYYQIASYLALTCERFCNGDDVDDNVSLDYIRLLVTSLRITDENADQALAKAIEKYHETRGWQKKLRHRDYWCGDSPTPEDLYKDDQVLACDALQNWNMDPALLDALWLFVPAERSDEVLRGIRRRDQEYVPRAGATLQTELEEILYWDDGSSETDMEEAGGEGLGDLHRYAWESDSGDLEAGRGAEEGQASDGQRGGLDAIEREAMEDSEIPRAEKEGYSGDHSITQRLSASAEF